MQPIKINKLIPIRDFILVKDMNFGERTLSSGIVMLGDDAKTDGIRPRWAQVYAVGAEQKEIQVGQWVLVEHGRWTRGSRIEIAGEPMTVRRIDASAIMMISDEPPESDDNISTSVYAQQKSREVFDV